MESRYLQVNAGRICIRITTTMPITAAAAAAQAIPHLLTALGEDTPPTT
jgi:hypothetical protein